MFNAKILLAVFATLAVFGATMDGGNLQTDKLKSIGTDDISGNVRGLLPNSLGAFSKYLETGTPDTYVKGQLTVDNPEQQELKFRARSVYVGGLKQVDVDGRSVKSDEAIVLNNFNGDIRSDAGFMIEGESNGFRTSGVNVSGKLQLKESIGDGRITAYGVNESAIEMKDVSGSISTNDTSATLENSDADLNINSFSGNFTFYPGNGTFRFEGEVDQLNAGSISFGN